MLLHLLPRILMIRSWIERTLAAHAKEARSAAAVIETCGFRRLPAYFDAALLGRIRCVAVERVPVPPLASMGLRLFAGFESKHYAGITYGDTYFVDRRYDLTEIEGIGPKIAGLLAANGIGSFSRLAKSRLGELQRILESGGPHFRLADPASWPEQAKLAAASDWAGLRELQGKLSRGRRV
jgi:hypothetical protein